MRVGVFTTHPVQYHVPVWRGLGAIEGMELHVHYVCSSDVSSSYDPGFQRQIKWDIDLYAGYEHEWLGEGSLGRRASMRLRRQDVQARLRSFDCIVLPGYTYPYEWQLRQEARRLGIPCVMRAEFAQPRPDRNSITGLTTKQLRRWFYRGITSFCSPGANGTRHLLEHGVRKQQIFWAPYCVDTELFEGLYRRADRFEARDSLRIRPTSTVVLFSGRFTKRKRPDLLIRALEGMNQRCDCALIMLGSGPLWRDVAAAGRQLLGDRFHAPGFVNQSKLGKYFAAADVLVLPSEYETWGLVVNEAMQFGLPVVVSDAVGCAPDLVKEGQTGFVFRSGDVSQLRIHLCRLCDNLDLIAEMGVRARSHIAEYSSLKAVSGIYAAIQWGVATREKNATGLV